MIDLCVKHDIYAILDLHAAPGGQNTDWHSDHGGHIANFWNHKDHQDRVLWSWEQLAAHYKENKWIPGYKPLNEPTEPKHIRLVGYYDRLYDATRKIDAHILFLDGNTFDPVSPLQRRVCIRFMITPDSGFQAQSRMMVVGARSGISPRRMRRRGCGWISVDYIYGTGSGVLYTLEKRMRVVPLTRSTILVSVSSRINLPSITGSSMLTGRVLLDISSTNFRLSRTVSIGLSGYTRLSDSRARSTSLQRRHT